MQEVAVEEEKCARCKGEHYDPEGLENPTEYELRYCSPRPCYACGGSGLQKDADAIEEEFDRRF